MKKKILNILGLIALAAVISFNVQVLSDDKLPDLSLKTIINNVQAQNESSDWNTGYYMGAKEVKEIIGYKWYYNGFMYVRKAIYKTTTLSCCMKLEDSACEFFHQDSDC